MIPDFNPYHRWLGIPPKHQPADHYRLLGIERFEHDPEVIVDAAERQMRHVRTYALGPHSDISQKILNELAGAQACLLNPADKAEYDRRLLAAATEPGQAVVVRSAASGASTGLSVVTDGIGMKLVLIPPGEFLMGSAAGDSAAYDNERPQHLVRIPKPFYLGISVVTQEQYEHVMGSNPSWFKGAKLPVECVSWEDAVAFCQRLSESEGQTYRLPTEAEWEYACRAGTTTRYAFGDDEAILDRNTWCSRNSGGSTQPVGQLRPNAWGLFDMLGNVFEWCADWYGADYYANSPTEDPTGPDAGTSRVLRGGSWRHENPDFFRSVYRYINLPVLRFNDWGFRVVRTLTP